MGTTATRPADGDSVRINVTGGYGDVIARVIRRPADTLSNWIYIVRGVGHVIDPAQGADPQAVRTIAQFAQWQTGRIDALAVFTAANKLTNATATGQLNGAGDDGLGDPCGLPSIYAVRVPTASPPSIGAGYATSGLGAAPHVRASGATSKSVADSTNIDWNALTTGGFSPDYTSAVNVRINASDYASQFITSDSARLNDPAGGGFTTGTGLLIAKDDLYVTGEQVQWNGIVLVGNKIFFQATDQRFDGIIISGLKAQLGATVAAGSFGTNYVDVDYDSCKLNQSLAKLTGFAPIINGWVDNWATY